MKTQLRIREKSANVEVNCARVDGKNGRKRRYCKAKKLWSSAKHEERTGYWNSAWKNKKKEKERKDRSNVGEEHKESWNAMLNLFAFFGKFWIPWNCVKAGQLVFHKNIVVQGKL